MRTTMTFRHFFIIIFSGILLLQGPSLYGQALISKKVPTLNFTTGTIFDQLQETIWVASDVKKNADLYVVFNNNRYGRKVVPRGTPVTYPSEVYPIKFVQEGRFPNSGIFIVPSREKVLYYSFYFLNQYYLLISPGYNQIEPLLKLEIPDYLTDGYVLQLVY